VRITKKCIVKRFASGHGVSLVACMVVLILAATDGYCTQDQFVYNYFCYRDENDTINEAFSLRLDKHVLRETKLELMYLHSDTRYWKVPLWGAATRYYSHGDEYSFSVEQKTFMDGKLTLGYIFTDRAIRLTDAYLIHEMEEKAKEDGGVGSLRKPRSSSYSIDYSQPFFNQDTTVEVTFTHTDADLTPYWEYNINTLKYISDRTTSYTNSLMLTVTQIFTQYTTCQLTASYATQSDLPAMQSYSASLHQYFPSRTSLQLYYRYSVDDDQFYTNTLEAKVYQYLTDEIILLARYRYHHEDDPSLDEAEEQKLREQQEYGGDLSVNLFPCRTSLVGGGVIIDILGLAGNPTWLGGDYLDKINLDIRYSHYRYNSRYDRGQYLDGDMYNAGLSFLF